MAERFSYKTLGPDQTEAILDAYRKRRSCLGASLENGVFASSATVSRVVNAAI
jgi:hypothetical protein